MKIGNNIPWKKVASYSFPAILFFILVFFLVMGLHRDPKKIPSTFVSKPVPEFSLARIDDPEEKMTNKDLRGHVILLNVWATWCESCQEEHAFLMKLKRDGYHIYGIDYKDQRTKAIDYLNSLGNPYDMVGFDSTGKVAINFGVYGTPETFVIDKRGVIRYKQIGPITPKVWKDKLAYIVRKYEA